MRAHLAAVPHIFNIVIADENGQLVVSTAAWPTPGHQCRRSRLLQDRAGARRRPAEHVGPDPQPDRRQPDHRLRAAAGNPERRFRRRHLRQREFELFRGDLRIDAIDQSLIFNLIREDGTILFRHPDPIGFAGKRLSQEAAWQDALDRGTKSFRILAKADNNYRYVSVRAVPEYPLFVNISVAENIALAGWLRRSAMIGLGSAALLLCSIYLLIAITRQVRSLSKSEASLMQTSQQLDAALNNMAHGISMFDKRAAAGRRQQAIRRHVQSQPRTR